VADGSVPHLSLLTSLPLGLGVLEPQQRSAAAQPRATAAVAAAVPIIAERPRTAAAPAAPAAPAAAAACSSARIYKLIVMISVTCLFVTLIIDQTIDTIL
jgi:hypothetical protein